MKRLHPGCRLILPALFVLGLAGFATAEPPDGPPPKVLTEDRLKEIVKEGTAEVIRAELKGVEDRIRAQNVIITKLQNQMEETLARLDKLERDRRNALDTARDEVLEGLRRQLVDLQAKIDTLNRQGVTERVAGANVGVVAPGVGAPAPVAQTAGRLRVTNRYLTAMVVQVNGTPYSVPADAAPRDILVPVGQFTYQIVGVHASPLTRQMTAGGVLPVDIYPQGQ